MRKVKVTSVIGLLALLVVVVFLRGSSPSAPVNGWAADDAAMAQQRTGACAALVGDGRALVTGGLDSSGAPLAGAEVMDAVTGGFSPASPMSVPRARHACAALPDGRVLVAGGVTTGGTFSIDT